MKIVAPDEKGIAEAAEAIRRGEVVAYPTETVYGLAVDPANDAAVDRLFKVKGRAADAPVLVMIGEFKHLENIVAAVSPRARQLMDAFWPGPLSLLLPSAKTLSPALTAGREKICVRLAVHPAAKALCDAVGGPITSTSANASGQPAALSVDELSLDDVAVAIDGGTLSPSAPSTVYDPDEGAMLREGVVTLAEIDAV